MEWWIYALDRSRGPTLIRIQPVRALGVTRVNSANILDEGLRIRRRGRQMNSKVKIQTNKAKLGAC
jgi:hypothetical protein